MAPETTPGLLMRLVIMATAFGPALPLGAVMASIGRRTMAPGLVATAVGGGLVAALLSFAFSMGFAFLRLPDDPLVKACAEAFLAASLPEEVAKFAVILGFVLRQRDAAARRDAVLVGGWVGLGFAILENFHYVTGSQQWLLTGAVRAALSVPGHVSWGLIMGYFIARHARGEGSILPALAVPVVLHGCFDAVLMYRDKVETDPLPTGPHFVILFALVLIAAWALIRWPVSGALAGLDGEPAVAERMSDDVAEGCVMAAGVSSLILMAGVPLAIAAAAAAAILVDARYASLAVLAIMPWTFVDLWRRA